MDFGSEFVYEQPLEEYEYLSEDEFHGGMDLSDSDSDNESEETPTHRAPPITKHHWRKRQSAGADIDSCKERTSPKRWFRKADTNVVSVSFNTLVSACNTHAGDPVVCAACQAIMSHISKINPETENGTWRCEFCDNIMSVDAAPEEIPSTEEVTYLLEPAETATATSEVGRDDSLVIFCVDTSGSMCVTTEVQGKVKLRGCSQMQRMASLDAEGENQYLPSQTRRDVTYVSRLEAMQTAVEHQLLEMTKRFPYRKVALVAFNNYVRIIGDGSEEEITVAGDKLTNMERLTEIGSSAPNPQPISQSYARLVKKVNGLEEGGATALGPALVIAVNMAAACPGSKVILCTDGKANIGLGNLEQETADEEVGGAFYSSVGDSAVSKCVSVSVTTIQGTDCKLVYLGQLANKTGGQVNIVDPLNLVKEFESILNEDFIATKVKSKFLVHKAMYIVDEKDPASTLCVAEFSPGNVQRNTEFTFAFARRSSSTDRAVKDEKGHPMKSGSSDKLPTIKDENSNDKSMKRKSLPKKLMNSVQSAFKKKDSAASSVSPPQTEDEGASAAAVAAVATPTQAASDSAEMETSPELETLSDYPFQVQIEYTDRQGARALRVLTRTLPTTTDRQVAESRAKIEILGAHAAKQSADLALQGEYTKSRATALMNQRLAWRSSHSETASTDQRTKYRSIFGRIKSMENALQQKQSNEIRSRGTTYSDEEFADDVYNNCDAAYSNATPVSLPIQNRSASQPLPKFKKKKKLSARACEMDDSFANMAYNFRRISHQSFDTEAPPKLPSGLKRSPTAE